MKTDAYYRKLLKDYPSEISKDQMYKICAISKKTCLYLLSSGLVPCRDTMKKTRRYRIRIADVITYLKDREINPEKYRPPDGYYRQDLTQRSNKRSQEKNYVPRLPITDKTIVLMRSFYSDALADNPDVLSVKQVAAFTGYCSSTVIGWCCRQDIKNFRIKDKYYIPKEYLLDFLVSKHFIEIRVKSEKHIKFIKAIWDRVKNSNRS